MTLYDLIITIKLNACQLLFVGKWNNNATFGY